MDCRCFFFFLFVFCLAILLAYIRHDKRYEWSNLSVIIRTSNTKNRSHPIGGPLHIGVYFLASSFTLSSLILDRSLQIYTRVLLSVCFLKITFTYITFIYTYYMLLPCLQIVFRVYTSNNTIMVIIIIKSNQLSGLSELTDFYC
jgi:hypothetical protein